jgi:hypothetical protein
MLQAKSFALLLSLISQTGKTAGQNLCLWLVKLSTLQNSISMTPRSNWILTHSKSSELWSLLTYFTRHKSQNLFQTFRRIHHILGQNRILPSHSSTSSPSTAPRTDEVHLTWLKEHVSDRYASDRDLIDSIRSEPLLTAAVPPEHGVFDQEVTAPASLTRSWQSASKNIQRYITIFLVGNRVNRTIYDSNLDILPNAHNHKICPV